MNLATYDPARVYGSRLTMAALDAQIARLRLATQNEREQMIGLDPRRADVILAGALLLGDSANKGALPRCVRRR